MIVGHHPDMILICTKYNGVDIGGFIIDVIIEIGNMLGILANHGREIKEIIILFGCQQSC